MATGITEATLLAIIVQGSTVDPWDLPPFTMVYRLSNGQAVLVGNREVDSEQVRRLEYTSKNKWVDTVLESAPIVTSVGTFSAVGSYTKLDGRKYIDFDAVGSDLSEDTIEENTRRIPGSFLKPFLIDFLSEEYGVAPVGTVGTTAIVCFHDVCQVNAEGLLYNQNGVEKVYANDARGIPLRIGDRFEVIELQIDDVQKCSLGANGIPYPCYGR